MVNDIRSELYDIALSAKRLARRYYLLTGKPLGVTGEIAELEVARILDLQLAKARQAGWDASRTLPDGRTERLQIKGRWMVNGLKRSARVGRIDLTKEFDAVLLVLLDEELEPFEIHRAEYAKIALALRAPGSAARNVRGQLSISKFISIGTTIWSANRGAMGKGPPVQSDAESAKPDNGPWPIEEIASRLTESTVLFELCKVRDRSKSPDTREHILEKLVRDALREMYGQSAVIHGQAIGKILGRSNQHQLGPAVPDVALNLNEAYHICEIKSGRIDYNRTHIEPGEPWFRDFFSSLHDGPRNGIWEVEQDLIRLRFYNQISPKVTSCLFLMVCAYARPKSSWTTVFSSAKAFRAKMRSAVMQDLAEEIIAHTEIRTIVTDQITARLIVCNVPLYSKRRAR